MTYYPLMKTRDAELRAYNTLSDKIKDLIIPIFELTKSRKTKLAPDGDIRRKMDYLSEILGEREFILDVTPDQLYTNPQIEDLLDETDGFYEWQYFLSAYDELSIIPTVHIYDEDEFSEVEKFVIWASGKYKKLALRVPPGLDSITTILNVIVGKMSDNCELILLIDSEFVSEDQQRYIVTQIIKTIEDASDIISEENIVVISTTFPRTPASLGDDDKGHFKIRELKIFEDCSGVYQVQYGDYASIHPRQYEMRGGTWIPRVDVSLDEEYIYTRYRREDGGYIVAAKKMLRTAAYRSINCWGDNEIESAAKGEPNGKNPSYWISVRMCIHMTRRALEFK